MSQKTRLRALLAAGVASALVAASATGALADTLDPVDPETAVGQADPTNPDSPANDTTSPGTLPEDGVSDNDQESGQTQELQDAEEVDTTDEGATEDDSEAVDSEAGDDEVVEDEGAGEEQAPEDGSTDEVTEEAASADADIVKPELTNKVEGDLHAEALWTVTKKTVKDVSKVTGPAGSKVPVAYQVDLSVQGAVSDVMVEGALSVKNPNKAEQTYTLEAVLKNGATEATAEELPNYVCAFIGEDADPNTPGHQVKVGAGQELDFDYACASEGGWFDADKLESIPYNFWAFLRAITLGLGEEGIAEIATKIDTSHVSVHNAELDVYDVNLSDVEGDAVHLGTVAATDGGGQFKYVMNLTVPADQCLDYVNAVYAVGDLVWVGDLDAELDILSDQATVTACPEAPAATKPAVKTAGAVTTASTTGEGELAKTGAESPLLGGIGAGLLGLGALAFGLSRRVRKA